MNRCISMIGTFCIMSAVAAAGVPQQINHQGVVRVNGTPFDGTGQFKFAIVDPAGPSNLWSNDGSITGAVGGIPTLAVSLPVDNGVYTIRLGNTNVPNMTPILPSAFNADGAVLRIWFDDGVNGEQQLMPDHVLTATPYSHRAEIGVPVGTIVSFAGSTTPEGWLLCDGSLINRADFTHLFEAIGVGWGAGDGATTFSLPDLRGRFLRGVDMGAGRDPNRTTRAAANVGGNSGDAVGSVQADAYRLHGHGISDPGHRHRFFMGNRSSGLTNYPGNGDVLRYTALEGATAFTGISIVPNGGSETRPVNAYVNWIIKK